MDFQKIVKTIDSLPPLSDVAVTVENLYSVGAENIDIVKLTRVIESDALLTANILRMINSPLYGLSRTIISISQAVTLFGTELVFALVLRFCVDTLIRANLRPYGLSNDTFNSMCQLQSMLMQQWYSHINHEDAEFLTPLALIMESGKLIIAREVTKEQNIKKFFQGLLNAEDILSYENRLFETTSYYISGLLFEHWNFDKRYVRILKSLDYEYAHEAGLDAYIDAIDVVRTAVNVKDILTPDSIQRAAKIVHEIGLNRDHFLAVAYRIEARYIKGVQNE